MEFFLFLPQMRLSYMQLVEKARAAEAAGFDGMVGMDHLAPPGAPHQPMYEALVTNTWIAAQTHRLKVGSLVQCDAFRHPAVLASQAVSIDHASGGRFELALGWGSQAQELVNFGVAPVAAKDRIERLRETLDVIKGLWSGKQVDYQGEYHRLGGAVQAATPLSTIPIVIGGGGPKTLALVREYADWWNLDLRHRAKFEPAEFEQLRRQVGKARCSVQEMVAYIPPGGDRDVVAEDAMRRFGYSSPVIGTGTELRKHFEQRRDQGIEREYVWFCDFASLETLADFGNEVINAVN